MLLGDAVDVLELVVVTNFVTEDLEGGVLGGDAVLLQRINPGGEILDDFGDAKHRRSRLVVDVEVPIPAVDVVRDAGQTRRLEFPAGEIRRRADEADGGAAEIDGAVADAGREGGGVDFLRRQFLERSLTSVVVGFVFRQTIYHGELLEARRARDSPTAPGLRLCLSKKTVRAACST